MNVFLCPCLYYCLVVLDTPQVKIKHLANDSFVHNNAKTQENEAVSKIMKLYHFCEKVIQRKINNII